jgi:hypothetical protein
VGVPVIDVLHKQVHLEVARVRWLIERLQQEARFSVANVGKIFRGPWDFEAEREIELLRLLEVARRHEGLDFNGGEVHRAGFRGLTYQANRRAAPMLTNEKPHTGPSG